MSQLLARCAAVIAFALSPAVVAAEPIKLKLSFVTSDRANSYHAAVKPFVDAVNAEARGLVEIEVYFSGALGKSQAEQPQLVLDGGADIAFVVAGQAPNRFPDTSIIEMPGLFRDMREATQVFGRLVSAGALKGYADFHVIGAYGTELETIHARPPVATLDNLRGLRIRANNPTEAIALKRLGMEPAVMPINLVQEAISAQKIDAAAVPPAMLSEFGIGRVATYHYMLRTSSAPLLLLMNRKKLDALPAAAQSTIHKYSGEWTAKRFVEIFEAINNQVMQQLESDSKRKVIVPSASDLAQAEAAFAAVREEAQQSAPGERELWRKTAAEIEKLRASE